ncbi:HD domain-containing protein [Desulfopila sp. IMCC35006]|uniref:HD-GYP domain-containing protein n=1 Tax=Desulfopila sp. IMCC35006 TaxID=2569542 RepID=UPI0010AD0149|nr:HD domain-containing phosphohydrolase [Desulfopila sp. IMCC35006]TKB23744.1 HD domain-containing protein [Desulfopila sp. IMCC35006]
MNTRFKKYLLFFIILCFAPLFREFFFGMVSHHHQPFATIEDILHTVLEIVIMGGLAGVLIFLDIRFTRDKFKELRVTQAVAIETLASLAEYRDAETSQHLQRIGIFVKILGDKLKKDSPYSGYMRSQFSYIEDLVHASVLHDIGKIAVPDGILLKPGVLTDEEFDVIKTHTTIGSDILTSADLQFQKRVGTQSYLTLALTVARAHHEKWDGSGYPDGLAGENIPLAARIVALCDVYDAVTSDRVYKKAWSHEEAVQMIRKNRGRHFDPVITDAFLLEEKIFEITKREYAG